MEIFDSVDLQRTLHPNLNVYSYVSKALDVKSRLDFFFPNCKKLIKTRQKHWD